MAQKKLYTLDTSVIYNDTESILNFGEHDVSIPVRVVMELEAQKHRGIEEAQAYFRLVENLQQKSPNQRLNNGGLDIIRGDGSKGGKLRVVKSLKMHNDLRNLDPKHHDYQIINEAYHLNKKKKSKWLEVILVSDDFAMLQIARIYGLKAELSRFGGVSEHMLKYSGIFNVDEHADAVAISKILNSKDSDVAKLMEEHGVKMNQYVEYGDQAFRVAKGHGGKLSLKKVNGKSSLKMSKIMPINQKQRFAFDALMDKSIKLVTIEGPAGTGKTLIAVAAAYHMQHDNQYKCEQILLSRRAAETNGEDIGFLPGDAKDKMAPYMEPFNDNIKFLATKNDKIKLDDVGGDAVKMIVLSYVRGRSLERTVWIIDEAQNLSPAQIKTVITRAGENTKIIFVGDMDQIDVPYLRKNKNGMAYLIENGIGDPLYAHITLTDVERSDLARFGTNLP